MNFKTQKTFSCKSRSKQKGEYRWEYKTYHKIKPRSKSSIPAHSVMRSWKNGCKKMITLLSVSPSLSVAAVIFGPQAKQLIWPP